jgi:hypothetical protein
MACAICDMRRPKRFCPGINADICTQCCGTEREVSVTCPLECEFLREARRHDKPVAWDPAHLPNRDIRVPEKFLRENEHLLVFLGRTLVRASSAIPGTVDLDVREALDALIRTYRTLESGVYYDTIPQGLPAADVYRILQQEIAEFRRAEQQHFGTSHTRDADVLGLLVFLQRVELSRTNGRTRGRAFLGVLQEYYCGGTESGPSVPSSLILP